MAPKGKDSKGKGKPAASQDSEKDKKVKGAQQINVRHILVSPRNWGGEDGQGGGGGGAGVGKG
jgi:hypothetical protein